MIKSYYSPQFGKDMKDLIDKLKSSQSKKFLISHKDLGVEKSTLRTRIYNSLEYLVKELDPSYIEIVKCIRVNVIGRGIILELVEGPNQSLVSVAKDMNEIKSSLQGDLILFLESAKIGDKFEWNDLDLNDDQISILSGLLDACGDDFIYNVRPDRVKVVRHGKLLGTDLATT